MATLTGSSISSSYEQLLSLPDGGGNGTSLVALTDGDGGTTFSLQLATTKTMIEGSGNKLFFGDEGGEYISGNTTALTLNSGEDINLTCASGDVNIPANIGLTFGDDGEKIEGDGTDLTIASSNLLNLTATTDVVIPVNVGLKFGDGNQHIETDNTDLTITSDVSINLSAPQVDLLVDTNFVTTGGVNGMSIDGTTFSVDGANNRIGIGIAAPTAPLHIDQSGASLAVPVVRLDQGDADESFIDFIGTTASDASTASIALSTATDGAKFGAIRVEINGTHKWIRVYDSGV